MRVRDNYCFVVTYSWACWDFKIKFWSLNKLNCMLQQNSSCIEHACIIVQTWRWPSEWAETCCQFQWFNKLSQFGYSTAVFCDCSVPIYIDGQFFFMYVYFYSVHVLGSHVPIIRRMNCINTTSGICRLYRVTYTRCHIYTITPLAYTAACEAAGLATSINTQPAVRRNSETKPTSQHNRGMYWSQ